MKRNQRACSVRPGRRLSAWSALLLGLGLPGLAAAAPPPNVIYVVRAETVSWMPIRLPDLAGGIGDEVASVLGGEGLLRLEKAPPDEGQNPRLEGADYLLRVHGEVVEQAGNFSVTLDLRPVRDPGLPSFVTAATTSISRVPKSRMYSLIIASARRAAQRLGQAVRSRLGGLGKAAGSGVAAADLFDWGKLELPRPRLSGAQMATLANGRLPWQKRKEAAFALSAAAFDRDEVRRLYQRIVLTDPDPIARYYAVRILGPVSRVDALTQQVILTALRRDTDPKVKREALGQSTHFVGLTPHRTVQSWVELLSAPVAELDRGAFAALVKLLTFYPAAPNVPLAILGCLSRSEALAEGRKRKEQCLDLLRQAPLAQQVRVLLAYLDRPLSALREDLPDKYQSGPYARALGLALKSGCRQSELRRVLLRQLEETSDAATAAVLLAALAEVQLTPRLVQSAARFWNEAGDNRVKQKLMGVIAGPAKRRDPPWGVLAWSASRAALQGILDNGAPRRWERRNLERSIEALDKRQQKAHWAGLAPHLRADGPPRASAIDYFARCVLEQQDRSAARDCARGLGWLVHTQPTLRRRALATVQGLLSQTRRPIQTRARRSLVSVVRKVQRRYRRAGGNGGGSCR